MKSYLHQEIGEEIQFISGTLMVLEEIRLGHKGRDFLCIISVGIIDNACCGVGGCLLIEVPGYVLFWNREKNEAGQRISQVIPVEGENEKMEITATLNKLYPYAQIRFG
jgi:hypothetical protein